MVEAKDLRDVDVLRVVQRASLRMDVERAFPEVPPKVVLAKCRRLIERKLLDGCGCGCRGDFRLTPDGLDLLRQEVTLD